MKDVLDMWVRSQHGHQKDVVQTVSDHRWPDGSRPQREPAENETERNARGKPSENLCNDPTIGPSDTEIRLQVRCAPGNGKQEDPAVDSKSRYESGPRHTTSSKKAAGKYSANAEDRGIVK